MNILLAGGGTAGHINPALAIADAIRTIMPDANFLFVGAKGKMEMDLIPKAGYNVVGIPVTGLQRRLSFQFVSFPFKLLKSIFKCYSIIDKFKPDVCIGTGGYVSWPAMFISWLLHIPFFIQEQNTVPGITNRSLGKFARRVFVAWDGMEKYFPKERILMTGNPLRQQVLFSESDQQSARIALGLSPHKQTIFVSGGSLGAGTINDAIIQNLHWWEKHQDIQLIWQCGRRYEKQCQATKVAELEHVFVMPFIQRMDLAYSAADLIIARAGALTIAELCMVGKPVVLIPSPFVTADHQTANAQKLAAHGAAVMIKDAEVTERLFPEVEMLLADRKNCENMRMQLRSLARPDAASDIAKYILKTKHKD